MSEPRELIWTALQILGEFNEIQKRPMKYAAIDELHWKQEKQPELEKILDEAYTILDPDYADQQHY